MAAAALDLSAVTTLHGFARRLLSEHPLAVGLPPVFDVADASASRVAFDERWQRFVAELLREERHADLVTRALSCGMTWRQLHAVARAAEENWERLTPIDCTAPAPALDLRAALHPARPGCRARVLVHRGAATRWPPSSSRSPNGIWARCEARLTTSMRSRSSPRCGRWPVAAAVRRPAGRRPAGSSVKSEVLRFWLRPSPSAAGCSTRPGNGPWPGCSAWSSPSPLEAAARAPPQRSPGLPRPVGAGP